MIPAAIKAAIAPYLLWLRLALWIGLVGFGFWWGSRSEAADHAQTKAKHAQTLAEIAQKTMRAAELAQAVVTARADELARIARDHEDERTRIANETRNRVLADIKSGKLRIGPRATAEAAKAAATAGKCDADAGLLETVLADMDRRVAESAAVVEQADEHVRACQASLMVYANE